MRQASEERPKAGGNDRPQLERNRRTEQPLPRWWVWAFYATIVWGIGYTIAYPAWPLIHGATPGLLGASTRADVEVEIASVDTANAPIKDKLVAADLTGIGT